MAALSWAWAGPLTPVDQPVDLAAGVLRFAGGSLLAEGLQPSVGLPHRWAAWRWRLSRRCWPGGGPPLAGPGAWFPGTGTICGEDRDGSLGVRAGGCWCQPPDVAPAAGQPRAMVTLGRWASYGLFIWHPAALAMAFPVIGAPAYRANADGARC